MGVAVVVVVVLELELLLVKLSNELVVVVLLATEVVVVLLPVELSEELVVVVTVVVEPLEEDELPLSAVPPPQPLKYTIQASIAKYSTNKFLLLFVITSPL